MSRASARTRCRRTTHWSGRRSRCMPRTAPSRGLTFPEAGRLDWEVVDGPGRASTAKRRALVTRPRDDIVVVDYVASTRRATSVTIVLDLARSAATTVVGTLPTAEQAARSAFELAAEGAELTLVATEFIAAAIDRPFVAGAHPHVPTDELVGKRVRVRLQPDGGVRAHLPEREPVHVAVSARQRAGPGRHRPLPLPQDRRRALPLRLAGEGHPDAGGGPRGLAAQAVQRQAVRLRVQRLRCALHDRDRLAGDAAQRHHPQLELPPGARARRRPGLDVAAIVRETPCHGLWGAVPSCLTPFALRGRRVSDRRDRRCPQGRLVPPPPASWTKGAHQQHLRGTRTAAWVCRPTCAAVKAGLGGGASRPRPVSRPRQHSSKRLLSDPASQGD